MPELEPPPPPRVFISYSWSSLPYENRVVDLAKQLVRDGVDVVIDKWSLREGQDKYAFMEQSINDPATNKVLLLCDATYSAKADARNGGVGTESQIISPQIYANTDQQKFLPVAMEANDKGEPYLPTFVHGRIYIDLSIPDREAEEYERLVRAIYGKPFYVRPSLGKPPVFVDEDKGQPFPNTMQRRQFDDAVLKDRSIAPALLHEYLDSLADIVAGERLTADCPYDTYVDRVIESIDRLRPVRDAFVDVIQFIAKYDELGRFGTQLHSFFERLLVLAEPQPSETFFPNVQGNNISFLSWELFLYTTAILLKRERFGLLSHLLDRPYLRESSLHDSRAVSYTAFETPLSAIDDSYKRKRGWNWVSTSSHLIKERLLSAVSFQQIIEADFVLLLRSVLHRSTSHWYWEPRAIVYARTDGPLAIFLRAKSRRFFSSLREVFGVDDADEFRRLLTKAIEEGRFPGPSRASLALGHPESLTGAANLATEV